MQTRARMIPRPRRKAKAIVRHQRTPVQKDNEMARTRSRLTHTRRRRITACAFHYAARSGHLIATTLWITLLAIGIALQFLWGITLGIAEGLGQLKKEMRAAKNKT